MTVRSDVSAMLLVKDDEHALVTIAQLRPHVAEIVLGYTPNEKLTEEALRGAGADLVVRIPGPLRDWSEARNKVLALCSCRYLLWVDSDDDVEGLARLPEALALLDAHPLARLLCPYDYAVDEKKGEVELRQWRERVVRNDGRFEWRYPCHEVLVARDGRYGEPGEREPRAPFLVWKHRRAAQPESLVEQEAMIRAWLDAHPGEPWGLKNLGETLLHLRRPEEAIPLLAEHVEKSGWDDERCTVMLVLARAELQVAGMGGDDARARAWVERAVALRPRWFEPHYEAAKLWYLRGALRGDERALREAVAETRVARAAIPTTDHPFAARPVERSFHVHDLERQACADLGDWRGAMEACDAVGEDTRDPELPMRRRSYSRKIERASGAAPSVKHGLDIVIACGPTLEPWNPATVAENGIGGSETAVIEVSRRLAAAGHAVRVIADCGGRSSVHDGVWWLPLNCLREIGDCDVAVAWRDARLLDHCGGAGLKFIWAHDLRVVDLTPERLAVVDRVMGVSAWHTEHLRKLYGFPQHKAFRSRNGIDLDRFAMAPLSPEAAHRVDPDGARVEGNAYRRVERDPHKAVYSSSFDRGLAVLLDLWPRIRAEVPDATLDVFYGFGNAEKVLAITGDLNLAYTMARCKRLISELPGVTDHGRVDQKTLARAMMGAGVLAYPTPWRETSMIGAMEAQAAGMRIVSTDLAALSETVGDRGTLIPGDWLDPAYQDAFVTAVIDAMSVSDDADRRRSMAYARANFSWDGVATEWLALFDKLLRAEEDDGELPPYEPDPEWAAMDAAREIERSARL